MNIEQILTISLEVIFIIYLLEFINSGIKITKEFLQTTRVETTAKEVRENITEVSKEVSICTSQSVDEVTPAPAPVSALPNIKQVTLKQLREIAKKDQKQKEQIEKFLNSKYYQAKKADLYKAINSLNYQSA